MEYCFASDRGRVREKDEDSVLVMDLSASILGERSRRLLFALADGMGGHLGGDIASSTAARRFSMFLLGYVLSGEEFYWPELLKAALSESNKMLYESSLKNPALSGMGTTLVAGVLSGRMLNLINVGDSRLYVLKSEGALTQVTKDHSEVQELVDAGLLNKCEAKNHPRKGILRRAIGINPVVEGDLFSLELSIGDIVLVCCDGLSDLLADNEIQEAILSSACMKDACDLLVARANGLGSPDNVSLILFRC